MAALSWTAPVHSQVINIPNYSFESQSGVGQPFGVNVLVDSWEKPPKPAYFDFIEQTYGIFWVQTAGVFLDSNPYVNRVGTQAGYLLSFPGVALFQDYNTVDWNDPAPTHDFNAVFEPGKSYKLTLGVYGKAMPEGALLSLSLYYRNNTNAMVTVGSTMISFSTNLFSGTGSLGLIDYEVNVPTVLPSDAWAGQNIGIKMESVFGDGNGYWDMDNVRLVAVPEPNSLALLGMGLAGLLLKRSRQRRC